MKWVNYLLLFFFVSIYASAQDCESQYLVTVTAQDNICNGAAAGKATIASSGCQCMFSGCVFQWSDGTAFHTAENLKAGTYTATVIHPDGCTITREVVITEPEPFMNEPQITAVKCENKGSIVAKPKEMAGEVSYYWSTGDTLAEIDGLDTGSYWVVASNFLGCVKIDTMVIENESTALSVGSTQITNTCQESENGTATITVSGGTAPYNFEWNGKPELNTETADHLAVGSYNVKVSDADKCVGETTVVINALNQDINAQVAADTICAGEHVLMIASGGQNYHWSPVEGLNNANVANPVASPEISTTYTVSATDANGCINTAALAIEVEVCAGEADLNNTPSLWNISPNPAHHQIRLAITEAQLSAIQQMYIVDMQGKIVQVFNNTLLNNQLDIAMLEAGLYLLHIQENNGQTHLLKFNKL